MRSISGNRTNKGFTLVEVIVSIAIIAILLMAGIYMLSGSITTIAGEGIETEILYQAQDVMEKLTSGVTVSSTDYPKLDWTGTPAAATVTMTGPGGATVDVEGKMYTIMDQSGNTILKAFIPN